MSAKRNEISVIITTEPMRISTGLLNANAFPDSIEPEVRACINRLAYLLSAALRVDTAILTSIEEMMFNLDRNWSEFLHSARSRKDVELIVYWDGVQYMSALHSLLYEIKAFLDLYSRLIKKLVQNDGLPPTFKSKNVDGKTRYGESFLRALRDTPVNRFENCDSVCTFIETNINEWIQKALERRDALAHFRDLADVQHLRINMSRINSDLSRELLQVPTIGGNLDLSSYTSEICAQLGVLIETVTPLLPEIKKGLLATWEQASTGGSWKPAR